MNLDCWDCGKKPPKDGPLFLVCPKCRDHKLIKCNFCSQECFKANWARHEEWHKAQWKLAKRMRKTAPKVEWPKLRGLPADQKEYYELLREAALRARGAAEGAQPGRKPEAATPGSAVSTLSPCAFVSELALRMQPPWAWRAPRRAREGSSG